MKTIYEGKIVTLKIDEVEKDGRKVLYEHVIHKSCVAVLPIFDSEKALLIRQYRPVIGKWIWEIPAGVMDGKEKPIQAAQRELEEETGYKAKKFIKLGEVYSSPGFTNELTHLFIAKELIKTEQKLEPDEMIKIEILSFKKIFKMIEKNEIKDSKSILTLLWAARKINLL